MYRSILTSNLLLPQSPVASCESFFAPCLPALHVHKNHIYIVYTYTHAWT